METPKYEVNILPQLNKACGFDMHKDTIVGFISDNTGQEQHLKEFPTFTEDLEAIVQWLEDNDVKHCLMESTGIHWISLYDLLTEAGIKVVVCNPMQVKQIPKRKTDKKDAKWLCMLLLNGLFRQSFIPDHTQHELRDYCRMRLQYTQQRTRYLNRIVRILERGNIKLRSVVSNIHIKSSMDIIKLICQGEEDIEKLIACCRGQLKKKIPQMRKALVGRLRQSDRDILKLLLGDLEHLDRNLEHLELKIDQLVSPHYSQAADLLVKLSGVGPQSAQNIIGEIGTDMDRFLTADHLTSWAGVAPGNHESAGKRRKTAPRKATNIYAPLWLP